MSKSEALQAWKGEFGNAYIERNEIADWKIENGEKVFRRILGNRSLQSVLEIGSNIGLNLLSLDRVFEKQCALYAVEPNDSAFKHVTTNPALKLADAWNCDASHLPLEDASVDLTFTSGVLIHVPPDHLEQVTSEIVRTARHHVLCIEYFSHTPTEIPYRGHEGLLFKRDFGTFYLDHYPCLRPIDYGFIWQREFANFDNLNWWLFEKTQSP